MPEAALPETEATSLFALGTTLLQQRRRILRWAAVGAVVAALLVAFKPSLYEASASFVPQSTSDGARSGLAELAGQFGVSLSTSNQSRSPDFYANILRSRVLLGQIARDTFLVREIGDRRISFLDLFKIDSVAVDRREELGVKLLKELVTPTVNKTTGVVQVSVKTRWPSVSLDIVNQLVAGVNDYNQRTRQSQAAAERRFLEGRLARASTDLRAAEDRLEQFLRTNRQLANSPQLTFENDRLRRNVTLQQQVYTTLAQAYEDASIREVRDTPVITMVEAPAVSSMPEPRGRLKSVALGFILGGFAGVLLAFVGGVAARVREARNADVERFFGTLGDVRRELLRPFGRRGDQRGT